MADLILVVDPHYGDRIEKAAQTAPVWVVDSSLNKAACERIWAAHQVADHREKGAITCYHVIEPEDRLGNLLNIVPTLEQHHGQLQNDQFSFPGGFVLQVLGLAPAEAVASGLGKLGFSRFVELADGFDASK